MGEKDLEYLATIIFLATRGGSITEADISQAIKVSKIVFDRVFEDSEKQFILGFWKVKPI